jgi:hypothetical protein
MSVTSQPRPSPVRSVPLDNGAHPQRSPLGPSGWAIAAALFIFGAIGWLMGARYTLEGWIVGLNIFVSWLGLPLTVPRVAGWFVLLCVPAGFIYSRVEVAAWQARYRKVAHFWVAWLLIVASDVGSTFLGVRYPPESAAPLALQVAAVPGIAFAWSVVLTFLPEWLMMGAVKLLRR